jgi:hypothetical protein
MSLSMRYLFVVAIAAGVFETLSAIWFNAPEVAGQVLAGVFAVGLLGCAWAMWARHSFVAATVIGVLLLVDVGGIPFYAKTSLADWATQLVFGLVGIVGLVAWVQLLRERRRDTHELADGVGASAQPR